MTEQEQLEGYRKMLDAQLDALVPQKVACLMVGLDRRTVHKRRQNGRFPKPRVSEPKNVQYSLLDLGRYIEDPANYTAA